MADSMKDVDRLPSISLLRLRTEEEMTKMQMMDFLSTFELEEMENLQESLARQMHDPSCFQEALQEMPPKLVILLILFVTMNKFELAHSAVYKILVTEQSNLGQRFKWANMLTKLLNQLSPQWNDIAINNLDQEVTVIIIKRDEYKMMGLKTMEAVFEANLWPGLELLYTEHKDTLLGKVQLNRIMLLAAWGGNCAVFMECLKLGANLTETVDVKCEVVGGEHVCVIGAPLQPDMKYSILHEAVKHGLDLEELDLAGGFPKDMVNDRDCFGNTLLHVTFYNWLQIYSDELKCAFKKETRSLLSKAKEVIIQNVTFLMKHKADVNIADKRGMTAIHKLVERKDFRTISIDMLVAMVEGAEKIEPQSWAPVNGWSALSLLCASGKYLSVLTAVEKGADMKHLCFNLTLIDMVILQNTLPYELKELTLAVLLNKPVSLGAFHASVVAQRPLSEENMAYRGIGVGSWGGSCYPLKTYLYPVQRLLFPLTYTRPLQKKHVDLVKMLVEGGAVCESELLALKPQIETLKEEDMHNAVDYLLPLIEALPPSVTAIPE